MTHNVFEGETKGLKECIKLPHVRGRANDWLTIEIMVYIFYLMTMLILMIKSRCSLIGIDQSKQFESFYLSQMANQIIGCIPFLKFIEKD